MCCWEKVFNVCCSCALWVFYIICGCCGSRQVYGGRKIITPKEKKERLLNRITSWVPDTGVESGKFLKILVIGPEGTGKSAVIRSFQSIFNNGIIKQGQGNEQEQVLMYEGKQLPIVLYEYSALSVEDNNVHDEIVRAVTGSSLNARESSHEPTIDTSSSDPIPAVIFVANIENICTTMTGEMMSRYTPLAVFLKNNDIPYCVVLTHIDKMSDNLKKQNIQDDIIYAQGTFDVPEDLIFPVHCYTTERKLVVKNDVHLLEPIKILLDILDSKKQLNESIERVEDIA